MRKKGILFCLYYNLILWKTQEKIAGKEQCGREKPLRPSEAKSEGLSRLAAGVRPHKNCPRQNTAGRENRM